MEAPLYNYDTSFYFVVSTLNCVVFVCWELLRQLVHYSTRNCVVFICWEPLRQRPQHRRSDQCLSCADSFLPPSGLTPHFFSFLFDNRGAVHALIHSQLLPNKTARLCSSSVSVIDKTIEIVAKSRHCGGERKDKDEHVRLVHSDGMHRHQLDELRNQNA